jgi:lauroyl/myristoyl acyltransferase
LTRYYVAVLGRLYFFSKRNERRKIESAVESVFPQNGDKLARIKREVFRSIFLHYYEKIFNAFSSGETLRRFLVRRIQTQGMETIDRGLSRGRGVLLVTGHFGGVEYIPGYLSHKSYPTTIIARFSSRQLRERSLEKAGQYGCRIIDAGGRANVFRAICRELKENRVVVTMCDEIEEWRPSKENPIPFLSATIRVDRTINALLRRAGPAVAFAAMMRSRGGTYTFAAHSLEQMRARVRGAETLSPGAVILKFLEQYIYLYPQEWYQWKNYAAVMPSPLAANERKEVPKRTLPLIRPVFGRSL